MARKLLFFTASCCCVLVICAQLQPYNTAIIWRGFEHNFTYNHRCNRMGNFVACTNGTPQATHISATGIGADSTYFNAHYTIVTTPDIVFKEGVVNMKIQMKETEMAAGVKEVKIQCEDWLRDKDKYTSMLNGFVLRSRRSPDKIQVLRLGVEDPVYDSAGNCIKLRVNYNLVFNCQSVECPELARKVDYDVDIHYLVAAYNTDMAHASNFMFARSYRWQRKETMKGETEEKQVCGFGDNSFANALTGVKSFSIILNEAHWMMGLNNSVMPVSYDSVNGCAQVEVNLMFKEGQPGMQMNSAYPQQSRFASRKSGWAMMDMDIVFLQMHDADIRHGNKSGGMFWRKKFTGKGLPGETIIPLPIEN